MTTSQQDPTHRRSATRAPVGRPIKLQFDDSMDVIEGLCRNISIGGMFIVFDSSRPAGSLVRFELELEDDNAIRGLGEVVWMRSRSEFKGPEAGFGLKFRFLEQRDRQMIFKLVSHHIKDRLANREPAAGEAIDAAALSAAPAGLSASIAVPPDPEPLAAEPPASIAAPPELPGSVAEPPESLFAPPESDLLPLELEAPSPVALEPEMPEAEAAGADPGPPVFSPEDPFDFELEPEPPPGEAPEMQTEDLLDEVLPPADLGLPEPEAQALEPIDNEPLEQILGELTLPPDPGPPPSGTSTLEPIDLDPSVGDTPLYELGLDAEPESARLPEPESPFGTPTPPPITVPGDTYLAEEPVGEDVDEAPRGVFAEAAPERERREFAILPVIGVLLVTAAAVGYLFKDELKARFGGSPPPVEPAAAFAPQPAAAESVEPASGEDPPSHAAEAPPSAEAAAPAESAAAPPTAAASPRPAPPPVVAETPPLAPAPAPPPPAPVPAASPPPARAETSGAFTHLLDISWSEASGGLLVVLTADGPFPTGRYRYFHLGGDAPREVVKLVGVNRGFRQSELTVGGPGVRRIRTGYHRVQGGNEQHVVIDLLGPRWKITEVRSVGSRLELTIAEE